MLSAVAKAPSYAKNMLVKHNKNNSHLFTTDSLKGSLSICKNDNLGVVTSGIITPQHLYFTSDEKIKEGDWVISINDENSYWKYMCNAPNKVRKIKFTDKNSGDGGKSRLIELGGWDENEGWYGRPAVQGNWVYEKGFRKIVATTNPELWYEKRRVDIFPIPDKLVIPRIGDDFVEAYIKAYNNGKPITEVYLESELDILTEPDVHDGKPCSKIIGSQEILKLRSNGTVIISPVVEKLYNLDEIEELFYVVDDYLNYLISNDKSSTKGSKHYVGFKEWFTQIRS